MGLLKALGNFLFGKDPDIFDANGQVRHQFSDEKWKQWNDRLKASPDYDWKNHVGVEKASGGQAGADRTTNQPIQI